MSLTFPDWDKKVLKFAQSQGGEVLTPSAQITTALGIVRVKCSKGHVWSGWAHRIAAGFWCRTCADEETRANSYKRVLETLKQKNAECLIPFDEFKNLAQKLLIRCKQCGFEYKRKGSHVFTSNGCRKCSLSPKRMPFEAVKQVAVARGGELLSKTYINGANKLLWKCEKGHRWESTYSTIKRGAWCPHCAKAARIKYSIKTAHELAAKHDGKCLSKKYLGGRGRLRWECKKGHRWEVSFNTVCYGAWCPRCAKDKLRWTVAEMKDLAKKRGGKFLSTEYTLADHRYDWECKRGHRFSMPAKSVLEGHWCSRCTGWRKDIADMAALAKRQGGKCLSEAYRGSKTKLKWECKKGHRWQAIPNTIQQGSWCPICARTVFRKKNKITRVDA